MAGVPQNVNSQTLEERLRAYGCSEFISLDQKLSKPEQLNYLDLLPKQNNHTPALSAVAEHQGTALLYIVDSEGEVKSDPASLADLRKQLANRSDPAWLGVVGPGSLEIFPIGFHENSSSQAVKIIEAQSDTAPLFFQSLAHGTFEENHRLRGTDYVFRKIFDLLTQTTNEFVPKEGGGKLDALEVLSMAGRSLFFRFLIDRRIVLPNELQGPNGICRAATDLKDTFSTAEKAAQTSAWLDDTFNGDFLPLFDESIPASDRSAREAEYLRFYRRAEHLVGRKIFAHLSAILRGWRAMGDAFQPELDWGDLNFAHIPVGVLSQVYESFSHRADPRTARDTSVHYTPRTIASLMVDEAFAPIKNKAAAMVLDPSCGAGIFLVLAFRRLVRERWEYEEDRPKTTKIQEILYGQLRGFDISESALRLAALGLYITAIELNASPRPPQSLKFPRNLRKEVLYRFGEKEIQNGKTAVFPLGSLGPEVSPKFNGAFDIVIGNPPWTRLRDDKDQEQDETKEHKADTGALNKEFTAIGRRVLEARGLKELAKRFQNPDKNPDLPFLWRAMEWAKPKDKGNPGGVIALAMPARLFGRTTGNGFEAWRAVLRSVEVTGLVNGADLRWSSVWKDVKMPFCLFFARNAIPGLEHRFYYTTPLNDPEINGAGRFRIDYEAAHPISATRVEKQPWILKTLSLGTWLDVEATEKLMNPEVKSLIDRWLELDTKGSQTGEGFNRACKTEKGPGSPQKWVKFLATLPIFEAPNEGYHIDYDSLRSYGDTYGKNSDGEVSANMPRREVLFQPPLVIIPKAPGDDPFGVQAYLADRPTAFSKAYYGFSCAGLEEGTLLASLIFLVMHSTAFRYFSLMYSSSLGVDRMILTKGDIDHYPFPDHRRLSGSKKAIVHNLVRRLQHDAQKPWEEINRFIFSLYGLDAEDVQVATDTLFAAASYRRAGRAALERTTRQTRAPFVGYLTESLEPYFDVCDEHVTVREVDFQPDDWREPWCFLSICRVGETMPLNPSLMHKAIEVANKRGTSRIIVNAPGKRGLLLGLLNQRRWWTITRARLCGQHILRNHLNAFGLPEHP